MEREKDDVISSMHLTAITLAVFLPLRSETKTREARTVPASANTHQPNAKRVPARKCEKTVQQISRDGNERQVRQTLKCGWVCSGLAQRELQLERELNGAKTDIPNEKRTSDWTAPKCTTRTFTYFCPRHTPESDLFLPRGRAVVAQDSTTARENKRCPTERVERGVEAGQARVSQLLLGRSLDCAGLHSCCLATLVT